MKAFHLICVGKLKDAHLITLENEYLKRITQPPLVIHEVRASAEDQGAEGEAILKKLRDLGSDLHRVALTENGKGRDSRVFAQWTADLLARPANTE